MGKISNAPDHAYDPEGLTNEEVKVRLKQAPDGCKIWVETGSDDPADPGELIGRVVEIQWGRDGAVYLRIDKTINQIREG